MDIRRIKKAAVMQREETDCGAACLLSLVKYYGGFSTMEKIRELCGTNIQGTTLLGLWQAAKQLGFRAEGCESNVAELAKYGKPVILHLTIDGKYQHYAVCYGFEYNRFILTDPAKGIVEYTPEELEQVWFSCACLTLEISEAFTCKATIANRKLKWLRKLLKDDYGLLIVSVIIGLAITALGITTAVFSQKIVDDIIPAKNYIRLWQGLLLLLTLLSIRVGLGAIRQLLLFTQSKDFNNRIISSFYNHLLHLPRSFFDTRKIGELVARLNDTRRIQQVISTIAGNTIIDILVVVVTIVALFYYSWEIAVVLASCIPIYMFVVYRFNKPLLAAQRDAMAGYAQSESNFIATMQGIDAIKNHNKQQTFEQLNRQVYGMFQENIFKLGKINIKLSAFSGMIGVFLILLVLGTGSYLALQNRLTTGELIAVITLASAIFPSIINFALVAIPVNEALVAFNRMFEFVGLSTEKEEGIVIEKSVNNLVIKNLSFRYPGQKKLLDAVSLSASRNEIVFIVGDNGSGKTTLCRLIDNSYEPESGYIVLNENCYLRQIAVQEWRKRIGVIPQEVFVFNGTVLDNICLGMNGDSLDMSEILNICARYGLDKYMERLPQGYMTIVGEGGVNLTTRYISKTFSVESTVDFAELTDAEIEYYVEKYRPFDKAGAYGIQEWIGYIGVQGVEGSFYNVMGLPVQRLYRELKRF